MTPSQLFSSIQVLNNGAIVRLSEAVLWEDVPKS